MRAHVARFSGGSDHQRRRTLATQQLAGVDVVALRALARDRTAAVLRATRGRPVDLMASVARVVPVELLASALGIVGASADSVAEVALAYHPHVAADAAADRAVAELGEVCGGVADERTAARIGLLVQACEATAGLVGNAAIEMLRGEEGGTAEEILARALLTAPPVVATRRQAVAPVRIGDLAVEAGTLVVLDLAAVTKYGHHDPLAFGAGPKACPGHDHALAMACGILESLRGCLLLSEDIDYEPSSNLRVPAGLVVVTC